MTFETTWTPEMQATLADMAAQGARVRDIAGALNVSRNAVIGRAKRTGVALLYRTPPARPRIKREGRNRRWLSSGDIATLRQMYLDGATYSEIGDAIGRTPGVVTYRVRDLPRRRALPSIATRYDRAFKVMVVAAQLLGESSRSIQRRLGCYYLSAINWRKNPDYQAEAEQLAARIRARWEAEAQAAQRAREAAEDAERARIDENNAPILARMSERHRLICVARVGGQTLQEIGDARGVSRERIRQIEAKWRLQGLIIPGAKPLNEEAARRIGVYTPTGRPRGRPRQQSVVKDDAYWRTKIDAALAAFPIEGQPS